MGTGTGDTGGADMGTGSGFGGKGMGTGSGAQMGTGRGMGGTNKSADPLNKSASPRNKMATPGIHRHRYNGYGMSPNNGADR